jgi:type II secretory pathway pseudopilin PulG
MIVVAIIAVLSTIAVLTISSTINRAQEAKLKVLAKNLTEDVHAVIDDHDAYHRYADEQDESYLNHRLESLWENAPYDNIFGHRNPYSASKVILNWSSVPSALKHPAVFVTSNDNYSYGALTDATAQDILRGTVIVWLKDGESNVDIFYVGVDGKKSSLRYYAQ